MTCVPERCHWHRLSWAGQGCAGHGQRGAHFAKSLRTVRLIVFSSFGGPAGLFARSLHPVPPARPPVLVPLPGHLFTRPGQLGAQPRQHLRGHAIALTNQAEQDVFGRTISRLMLSDSSALAAKPVPS